MALIIPTDSVANQTLNIVLNTQNCTINLFSRNNKLFMDLFVNNINIIYGRKLSITPLLPYPFMSSEFIGNFIVLNNNGNLDVVPDYKLLGSSQSLIYFTQEDINGSNS